MIEANSNLRRRAAFAVPFAEARTVGEAASRGSEAVSSSSEEVSSSSDAVSSRNDVASGRGARTSAVTLALLMAAAFRVGPAGAEAAPSPATPPSVAAPAVPAAATDATSPRLLDGVVAVVDGDPITLRELKRYGVTGAPFLPPEVRNDYSALLDSMVEHRLLKAEFDKNGIHAPDDMVERYIAGVLEENHQTRASLEFDIAKAGLTWKDYFERMREEVQRIQLINLLIRSRVNVPEEAVKRVWENDPQYLESEKLQVGVIFLPLPLAGEEADKLREKAPEVVKAARSNFAAAAKKYSKGPAASEGGDLGEFRRGSLAAQYETGLKGLDVGDVSEPVEGPGGLYIVKLIGIKSSGRVPFDDVKKELTEKLYEKRLNERYQKWATEDLRKDHRVENLVDKLALTAASEDAPAAPAAPSLIPPTVPVPEGAATGPAK